jgi:hypothetical protein
MLGKEQKVGTNATMFSHLKGKSTEKKAGLVYSNFFEYATMATPCINSDRRRRSIHCKLEENSASS